MTRARGIGIDFSMRISIDTFNDDLDRLGNFTAGRVVAAAVSGGPDSMAMLWLLSRWAQKRDVRILAYTVDHGLRAESADEAKQVGAWVATWLNVDHTVLCWEGEKPESRILEEARAARYRLMADAMARDGVAHLFIAHHRDDQAETFLTRLAKGSGLDGLAGMAVMQEMAGMVLVRPLLDLSKDDLVLLCRTNNVPYVDDPTNENKKYLRPRLRAARAVLEEEGLSAKRLAVTARRLGRAREALEKLSADLFARARVESPRAGDYCFDYKMLSAAPEELVLRAVLCAMEDIHPAAAYGPRMERAESLVLRLLYDPAFNGATLGGCRFALDRKNERLCIGRE